MREIRGKVTLRGGVQPFQNRLEGSGVIFHMGEDLWRGEGNCVHLIRHGDGRDEVFTPFTGDQGGSFNVRTPFWSLEHQTNLTKAPYDPPYYLNVSGSLFLIWPSHIAKFHELSTRSYQKYREKYSFYTSQKKALFIQINVFPNKEKDWRISLGNDSGEKSLFRHGQYGRCTNLLRN